MNTSRISLYFLIGFIFCCSASVQANNMEQAKQSINDAAYEEINSPLLFNFNAAYSYRDFEFDSTIGDSFNRFQGTSSLYGLGGNNYALTNTLSGGFFIYKINTNLSTQLQFNSSALSTSSQNIYSNDIYAHLLKKVLDNLYIDLAGGYGQNKLNFTTIIYFAEPLEQYKDALSLAGFSNNFSKNWYTTLTALANHNYKQFIFNANAGFIYSKIVQDGYTIFIPDVSLPISTDVPGLKNSATFLQENLEIAYAYSEFFKPFIEGGLLQVVSYQNSRPLISPLIVGPLPALNLDVNGFQVGGGFMLNYKRYSLRFDQQYFQRSSIYHSNQSSVSVTMNID